MPLDWSTMPIRWRSSVPPSAGSKPSTRTSPAVARAVALEDLHRRRLPRAVRSDHGHDLAGVDVEAQPAHRLDVAVRLAQPIRLRSPAPPHPTTADYSMLPGRTARRRSPSLCRRQLPGRPRGVAQTRRTSAMSDTASSSRRSACRPRTRVRRCDSCGSASRGVAAAGCRRTRLAACSPSAVDTRLHESLPDAGLGGLFEAGKRETRQVERGVAESCVVQVDHCRQSPTDLEQVPRVEVSVNNAASG